MGVSLAVLVEKIIDLVEAPGLLRAMTVPLSSLSICSFCASSIAFVDLRSARVFSMIDLASLSSASLSLSLKRKALFNFSSEVRLMKDAGIDEGMRWGRCGVAKPLASPESSFREASMDERKGWGFCFLALIPSSFSGGSLMSLWCTFPGCWCCKARGAKEVLEMDDVYV